MKNEFNNYASEFFRLERENLSSQPNASASEKGGVGKGKEYGQVDAFIDTDESKATEKSKKANQKKLQTTLLKLASVCTGVTVFVASGVIPLADAEVEFLSVEATQSSVSYVIEVQEEGLLLELTNDFTKRKVSLTSGVNEGEIGGLVSNMRYILKIYTENGVCVETYEIRTMKDAVKPEEQPEESVDDSSEDSTEEELPFVTITELKQATAADNRVSFVVNILRTDEAWGEFFQYSVYLSNESETEGYLQDDYKIGEEFFAAYPSAYVLPEGVGKITVSVDIFDENMETILETVVIYEEVLKMCDQSWIEENIYHSTDTGIG